MINYNKLVKHNKFYTVIDFCFGVCYVIDFILNLSFMICCKM